MLRKLMVATLIDRPDLIQVTYKFLSDALLDPEKKAKEIALGQTIGMRTPTAVAEKIKLAKYRGTVLGIDERTHVAGKPYEYYLTIGFPARNTEGDIPSLLNMIFGRVSMDGRVRLESIQFPEAYLKGKGPRFGIPGIREKVGEPASADGTAGKPLTMATFKSAVGMTAKELGTLFYELACGGMHLVRDPDILPDLPICPTEERLEACLLASLKAKQETGQSTLYALNLTGSSGKIVAKARKLAKLGAPCFLFNVLSYGYGLLEELREVGVPLVAYPSLAGALCGSPETGMSYAVALGSLMRLGGADVALFPSSYGPITLPSTETKAIKEALTWSTVPLLKSFPAPFSGIYPGLVPTLLQEYGRDVILNAGNSVHTHPKGPRAGAKALRQAIQWIIKRGNFGGMSEREFPELAEALRQWGKK